MERSDSNSVEEQLLILNKSLYCSDLKLSFRPRHLLIHESFTNREVSFEYNAEELGNALTLLANLEESGTGIRHEVGLAAFGIDGNIDFIWSRSAKTMAQALMASCSSLLNTLIFAANQSSASCTLCCCSSSTACDIAAARSCSSFSTVSSSTATFFFMTLYFTIFAMTKQ